MKTKPHKNGSKAAALEIDGATRDRLAAARRMGRMVRAENRRWGLPLIVMKDGKIRNVPA